MEKLRIAVIGCGRIAPVHFSSINMCGNAQLVACCDVIAERAQNFANQYNVPWYTDYKQMLDSEHIDVVHLCLPHDLHVPVSIYCMQHGVHVLCEKPMAISYEEALQAVQVSQQTGKQYGVIFQCRYNDAPSAVKKLLQQGKLGKVLSARSVLTWCRDESYYQEADWKGTWEHEGGGVIINQAIHSLDLVNWLIDSTVTDVKCTMHRHKNKVIKVEDTAEGVITYQNGARYLFYASNNYAINEPIEIRLCCENANVILTYDEATVSYHDGRTEHYYPTDNSVAEFEDYWGYTHIRQIRQFYNACLGLEQLQISGQSVLQFTKLICDIYKQGRKSLPKE